MVLETQFPALGQWAPGAMLFWIIRVGMFCLLALIIGFLITGIKMGPRRAAGIIGGALKSALMDLFSVSPKRVWAIAMLSFKEAIRRKVLIGFVVFIVVLLFAGMFLDPQSQNPARLYINFIFWVNNVLILLLMLFISTFSIPNDFKYKTIYTLVTKPLRAGEMVLGRILGFALMGTAMLAVMGLLSYGFVLRSVAHTHKLTSDDLRYAATSQEGAQALEGKTSRVKEHRHNIYLSPEFLQNPADSTQMADPARGHSHQITISGTEGNRTYAVSGVKNMFTARVPVYGQLRFRDNTNFDTKKGICVGDEWTYRSFIQGNSPAALVWSFSGISEGSYPQGLPVEMTLGVFRTHKGNIERGVMGALAIRNPETGLMVETHLFESIEFDTKRLLVPVEIKPASRPTVISSKTKLPDGSIRYDIPEDKLNPGLAQKSEYNLFTDLVASNGQVEIWVRCLDPMQYFGAAEPDLYVRSFDAPFALNFVKGFLCMWMEMFLIVVYGVILSTFVSAPIAILGTMFILVTGVFHEYVIKLARGLTDGGGILESLYRLLRQDNMISELPDNILGSFIRMADQTLSYIIGFVAYLAPDMNKFANAEYVASGFDIPWNLMAINALMVLGFFIPLYIAGYLCMKLREIAA